MSTQNELRELLRQTPIHMTHVTVGRWLIEWLLKEVSDNERDIKRLKEDLEIERNKNRRNDI